MSMSTCLKITLPSILGKTSNVKKIANLTREQQVVGSWFTATIYGEYDSIEQVEEAVRDANKTRLNTYFEGVLKDNVTRIKDQIESLNTEINTCMRN